MFEVLEVISRIVLLLALFAISWSDYKTQLLDIRQLLVVGIIGVLFCASWQGLYEAIGGMLIGFCVLFAAWCTKESIGFGDGWLFVVTGLYLGFKKNAVLLFWTLVLAGIFAVVCIVLKRKGRNDSMALGPFVLMSYVLFVL